MSTLWLIGMMGSGKSTIGRMVATMSGRPFIDLDATVEAAAGRSVREIFVDSGEESFRDLEAEALTTVAGRRAVVACGGGAALRRENRATMRHHGLVVWLRARTETLVERLSHTGDRPLLAGPDPAGSVALLQEKRRGDYLAASHHAIVTDGREPEELAEEVVGLWP